MKRRLTGDEMRQGQCWTGEKRRQIERRQNPTRLNDRLTIRWGPNRRTGQDRRKWVTQDMLCSAEGFESSKPGRTGRDNGAMWIWGLLDCSPVFQTSVRAVQNVKCVSGLDYRHNPSDHPAARHPAQPSLNRQPRIGPDGPAGKRQSEAERGGGGGDGSKGTNRQKELRPI